MRGNVGRFRLISLSIFAALYFVLIVISFVNPDHSVKVRRQVINAEVGFLPKATPLHISPYDVYASPSLEHVLGTDDAGRDLLVRLAHGAQTSMGTALVATVFFLVSGLGLGIAAGYFESKWQGISTYLLTLVSSFPILLLLLLCVIVIDGLIPTHLRIWFLMAFLGLFSSPKLAELIRGKITSLKETSFVEAAVALGLTPEKIVFKHIIWLECRPLILVQCAYMMGWAVLAEITLTYLTMGVEGGGSLVSWGLMFRNMAGGMLLSAGDLGAVRTGTFAAWVVVGIMTSVVLFFQYLAAVINDITTPHRERA